MSLKPSSPVSMLAIVLWVCGFLYGVPLAVVLYLLIRSAR